MLISAPSLSVSEDVLVHGEGGIDCDWCDLERFRAAELFLEGELTFFASNAFAVDQVLPGAGVVCPVAHCESPFELTAGEWAELHTTLRGAKELVNARLNPDGYNLIWNVMPTAGQEVAHVHLHRIPRFADEPLAGRGARWMLKQAANRRPNPLARGEGAASL